MMSRGMTACERQDAAVAAVTIVVVPGREKRPAWQVCGATAGRLTQWSCSSSSRLLCIQVYWVVVVVYVWLTAEKLQPSAKETTTENKEQCLKV